MTSTTSVMQHLSTAFLTWRRHLQRRLVPYEITLKQVDVLRQLIRREYLHPSRIAELLHCDRPTATVIVRNMEREGWVTRAQDDQDRRQVRVAITEQGRRKLDEIAGATPRDLARELDPLGCFDERQVAELDHLLVRLNAHLARLEHAETRPGEKTGDDG